LTIINELAGLWSLDEADFVVCGEEKRQILAHVQLKKLGVHGPLPTFEFIIAFIVRFLESCLLLE